MSETGPKSTLILELPRRQAEVINRMLGLMAEELTCRPLLRETTGITLTDLVAIGKLRKKLSKQP